MLPSSDTRARISVWCNNYQKGAVMRIKTTKQCSILFCAIMLASCTYGQAEPNLGDSKKEAMSSMQSTDNNKKAPTLAVYEAANDNEDRKKGLSVAYLAAGCFWGVETALKEIDGVIDTTVGYMGGKTENPTYRDVCNHDTGHAEAVRVVYDPKKLKLETLIQEFLAFHDPTTVDRQGPDIGSQYRSAIFYGDDSEKSASLKIIQEEQTKPEFQNRKIVTRLEPFTKFYSAEDYHQDYFEKNPGSGCHIKRK